MVNYKDVKSRGFFGEDENLKRLRKIGNPLQTIAEVVDFETFRPLFDKQSET